MMRAATKRAREEREMATGDEGGERSTVTRVKKRVRVARATATWVAGDEEGEGDGGKGNGNHKGRSRSQPALARRCIPSSSWTGHWQRTSCTAKHSGERRTRTSNLVT
jgi:hypothetical protein